MITDHNKDIATITYNHLNLPTQVTKTDGQYIQYIYDAAGIKLAQEVFDASAVLQKRTDYVGEFIYETTPSVPRALQFIQHEEGRIMPARSEYQYHLKDHLGNVRLTFTTKPETTTAVATMEEDKTTEERSEFLNYDYATKINSEIFDHTNAGGATSKSIRLLSGQEGLAKSLQVQAGDVIDMTVFAKYVDRNQSANWSQAMTNLIAAMDAGNVGTIIDGVGTAVGNPVGVLPDYSSDNSGGPQAYLNWIVMNEYFDPATVDGGFVAVNSTALETGTDSAHQELNGQITISQPGFVYIWLSNDATTNNYEVYFDDFTVTQQHGPVVQADDYYPFGLSFNSWKRDGSLENDFLYNGKEKQDELDLDWMDYGARMYMSDIGRWGAVDPLAEDYFKWSTYNYVLNNPLIYIDPDGRGVYGWVEGPDGEVIWVSNTNSQEEFEKNYSGQDGYSYVSDEDNPNSYTLPNGDGKLVLHEFITYDAQGGVTSPSIEMEFIPTDTEATSGWFQTFTSNIPDAVAENIYSILPQENSEERLDIGSGKGSRTDVNNAKYYGSKDGNQPKTSLYDWPIRAMNGDGAVHWDAQSSMVINGEKSFSVGWGFSITGKESAEFRAPKLLKTNSKFHNEAIKYLKK